MPLHGRWSANARATVIAILRRKALRAWGSRIEGLTAIGRTTAVVLGMNDARRLDLRAELLARGEFLA
jgi:hypothetical protein